MLPDNWLTRPPSHIHLGVTAEDQPNADRRIPPLRAWRGKNFVSCEPALGPVDWESLLQYPPLHESYKLTWGEWEWRGIDWLICGGESGAGYRVMDLAWARSAARTGNQPPIINEAAWGDSR